jgi:hypothetical protein
MAQKAEYAVISSIVSVTSSQTTGFFAGMDEKNVRYETASRRFRVAEDVSVLQPYHASLRDLLPGVRQSAQHTLIG